MKRSIYPGLSATALLLAACAADFDTPAHERHPPKEWESPAFQDEVGPGRYREVAVHGRAGGTRVVPALEGYFEDAGPMQVSSDGTVRLHEIATGRVAAADQAFLHDRYYCTFVSARTGCVYARETGSFCDGSWRQDGLWATTSEQLIDIKMLRITAEEVASGTQELGGQIDNSYENLLRCDPPSNDNNVHYDAISGQHSPDG